MDNFILRHLGSGDETLGEKKISSEDLVAEMYGLIEEKYHNLVAYIQAEGPCGFRAIRRNPRYRGN